ncbi:MAG: hypothetical protein E7633_00510 [Ruminococcaceae bacterium]|nr:hypothetical protein [Oscillospiraceae bacterium]
MKKKVFYTELAYALALIIMAFAAAFTEKADFGMSMVVAPAYIIHLKVSEILPWFTFGVAEYCFQGLLVLITILVMRRFKASYLFSFVTAVLYGTLLDGAMYIISGLPDDTFIIRVLWYVLGTVFCSLAVSLFFHTYISPEAYELIVKELSAKLGCDINKVKTAYDCFSTVLGILLSFAFFGFGVFEGVKLGTILCAVINGFLISRFTRVLEHFFDFKNKFKIEKYFR